MEPPCLALGQLAAQDVHAARLEAGDGVRPAAALLGVADHAGRRIVAGLDPGDFTSREKSGQSGPDDRAALPWGVRLYRVDELGQSESGASRDKVAEPGCNGRHGDRLSDNTASVKG